jgi:hypothetical protein
MNNRYGEYLKSYLEYDETSPSCLRWIKSTTRSVVVGGAAGHYDGSYWNLKLHGKLLKAHKVVWALHNEFKDQTRMEIDHRDGDTNNNKSSNLRLVMRKTNMQNRRLNTSNTFGNCGVRCRVDDDGSIRYIAYWREVCGKQRSKTFSVNKLGDSIAKESAIMFRNNQIERLNAEGADYTERHGVVY